MREDAARLDDVAALPGNRFEALKGDSQGQHSLRMNHQYRMCFVWRDGDAHHVEIVDDHSGEEVTMATRLVPMTPGEMLRDEFMAAYGLSQNKLALALHVPVSIINRVVHNKYRITAKLALRFAAYFGTSAQFWMHLQTSYDLRIAERQSGAEVKREIQPVQLEPVTSRG